MQRFVQKINDLFVYFREENNYNSFISCKISRSSPLANLYHFSSTTFRFLTIVKVTLNAEVLEKLSIEKMLEPKQTFYY